MASDYSLLAGFPSGAVSSRAGAGSELLPLPPLAREVAAEVLRQLADGIGLASIESKDRWEMRGEGTLAGLFAGEIVPSVWRPRRERHNVLDVNYWCCPGRSTIRADYSD